VEQPVFRSDLYKGTAPYYDRFRPPYPTALLNDLLARAGVRAGGRLLDLACGTGQLAFALRDSFAEVWAVDQEPEAVDFGREKARAQRVTNVRWLAQTAEALEAPAASFDLITIGNAFHRLRRREVARNAFRWLKDGGCLALVWGDLPSQGQATWQRALLHTIESWAARMKASDRVPTGWDTAIEKEPHRAVLEAAGFETVGRFEFTEARSWTVEDLIGLVYSTSLLPKHVLGDLATEFEADVTAELLQIEPSGQFHADLSFAYDLARRPARG
jgi:ubiquinone/menaquinone biosynthesis C-methylase UbiE